MTKKKKYVVLSPDGFPIHHSDTYPSIKKAKEAFFVWSKNYERQGYYSSTRFGQIPVPELIQYVLVKEI
jgi:AAA+ superfamily predicted ATPase